MAVELLDFVVDHLHDTTNAFRNFRPAIKPCTNFTTIGFCAETNVESLTKKTFPDPSTDCRDWTRRTLSRRRPISPVHNRPK